MEEGSNLNKFILGIVIVGVTLVIGIYVAATMQNSFRDVGTSGSAVNESVTMDGTNKSLDSSRFVNPSCGTITNVVNATGFILNSANYTQVDCLVINKSSLAEHGAVWLYTYPYSYDRDTVSSNGSGDLVTALNGGSAWITILVVVGFAVIVLGMLSSGLGRAGQGTASGIGEEYENPIY